MHLWQLTWMILLNIHEKRVLDSTGSDLPGNPTSTEETVKNEGFTLMNEGITDFTQMNEGKYPVSNFNCQRQHLTAGKQFTYAEMVKYGGKPLFQLKKPRNGHNFLSMGRIPDFYSSKCSARKIN